MNLSFTNTETKEGEVVSVLDFNVDIEESTFMKEGKWQQSEFNLFLHDSLQQLKGKGGVPIESLKAIKDKKL